MTTRYLYFVRHGQYRPSASGGVLTGLGRKQARRTGQRLNALPWDSIVSSDLSRAVETTRLIASKMSDSPRVRSAAVLRETRPSAFPGVRVSLDERRRGKAQVERLEARFLRPARRSRRELYVCHGNVIRILVARALGQSWTAWKHMGTHHCGVTVLEVRPGGRIVVASYNDTGHLPHDWITST